MAFLSKVVMLVGIQICSGDMVLQNSLSAIPYCVCVFLFTEFPYMSVGLMQNWSWHTVSFVSKIRSKKEVHLLSLGKDSTTATQK